jgi:hypothetical protein
MSSSKLFSRFVGKSVNIIMKNVRGSQVLENGTVIEGNVVITGFLLDEDDEYFYIGREMDEIDEALLRDDMVRIFTGPTDGDEFIDMTNSDGEVLN